MNKRHTGNGLKEPKREFLKPREADLLGDYLRTVSTSLGMAFDRISRMDTGDWHHNPAATFGAPVISEALGVHDNLGTATADRKAEEARLEEAFADPSFGEEAPRTAVQPTGDQELADLRQVAYDNLKKAYENV